MAISAAISSASICHRLMSIHFVSSRTILILSSSSFLCDKDGFAGDSCGADGGLRFYELNKQLPSPIYSDFTPDGYYDPSAPIGSTSYSALIDGAEDIGADSEGSIIKDIKVTLPTEFGVRLYNQFKTSGGHICHPTGIRKMVSRIIHRQFIRFRTCDKNSQQYDQRLLPFGYADS